MSTFILVGKRLVSPEHIALIEPFDPAAAPRINTVRNFQARIVLVNRDSMLTEYTPEAFAAEHGFRVLAEDQVAINPAIPFRVETFEPAEGFKPSKPFRTRLLWCDLDGNDQSKLLLAAPETVFSIALKSDSGGEPPVAPPEKRTAGARRRRVQPEARV